MPLHGKIVIIKRTGQDGSTYPFRADSCVFGKSQECDVRIQLPNVSAQHCGLTVDENGKVYLSALAKNPTFLNGDRVTKVVPIGHKDVFTIIDRSFRFEYPPRSIHRPPDSTEKEVRVLSPKQKPPLLQVASPKSPQEHFIPRNRSPMSRPRRKSTLSVNGTSYCQNGDLRTRSSSMTSLLQVASPKSVQEHFVQRNNSPSSRPKRKSAASPDGGSLCPNGEVRTLSSPMLPLQNCEPSSGARSKRSVSPKAGLDSIGEVGSPLPTVKRRSSPAQTIQSPVLKGSSGKRLSLQEQKRNIDSLTPSYPSAKKKRVSFGPELSPEQFDQRLPASTPLKRGGFPFRLKAAPNYFGSPILTQFVSLKKSRFSPPASLPSVSESAVLEQSPEGKAAPPKQQIETSLVENNAVRTSKQRKSTSGSDPASTSIDMVPCRLEEKSPDFELSESKSKILGRRSSQTPRRLKVMPEENDEIALQSQNNETSSIFNSHAIHSSPVPSPQRQSKRASSSSGAKSFSKGRKMSASSNTSPDDTLNYSNMEVPSAAMGVTPVSFAEKQNTPLTSKQGKLSKGGSVTFSIKVRLSSTRTPLSASASPLQRKLTPQRKSTTPRTPKSTVKYRKSGTSGSSSSRKRSYTGAADLTPVPKIIAPTSPDSKKSAALRTIHAAQIRSQLRAKGKQSSSAKRGPRKVISTPRALKKPLWTEVLKRGLMKQPTGSKKGKTPRKIIRQKKKPREIASGTLKAIPKVLDVQSTGHATSPATIIIDRGLPKERVAQKIRTTPQRYLPLKRKRQKVFELDDSFKDSKISDNTEPPSSRRKTTSSHLGESFSFSSAKTPDMPEDVFISPLTTPRMHRRSRAQAVEDYLSRTDFALMPADMSSIASPAQLRRSSGVRGQRKSSDLLSSGRSPRTPYPLDESSESLDIPVNSASSKKVLPQGNSLSTDVNKETPQGNSSSREARRSTRKETPIADYTDVDGIKMIMRKGTPKANYVNVEGVKRTVNKGTPQADYTNVEGVRRIMRKGTPQPDYTLVDKVSRFLRRGTPPADYTNVEGIKRLMKKGTPPADYTKVEGVRRIGKKGTPPADYTRVEGLRQIMKKGTPKADYQNIRGVKELLSMHSRSPASDYTSNIEGLKQLFVVHDQHVADYTDVAGVARLLKSPRKSPRSSYSNLTGVEDLFKTPPGSLPAKKSLLTPRSANRHTDLGSVSDIQVDVSCPNQKVGSPDLLPRRTTRGKALKSESIQNIRKTLRAIKNEAKNTTIDHIRVRNKAAGDNSTLESKPSNLEEEPTPVSDFSRVDDDVIIEEQPQLLPVSPKLRHSPITEMPMVKDSPVLRSRRKAGQKLHQEGNPPTGPSITTVQRQPTKVRQRRSRKPAEQLIDTVGNKNKVVSPLIGSSLTSPVATRARQSKHVRIIMPSGIASENLSSAQQKGLVMPNEVSLDPKDSEMSITVAPRARRRAQNISVTVQEEVTTLHPSQKEADFGKAKGRISRTATLSNPVSRQSKRTRGLKSSAETSSEKSPLTVHQKQTVPSKEGSLVTKRGDNEGPTLTSRRRRVQQASVPLQRNISPLHSPEPEVEVKRAKKKGSTRNKPPKEDVEVAAALPLISSTRTTKTASEDDATDKLINTLPTPVNKRKRKPVDNSEEAALPEKRTRRKAATSAGSKPKKGAKTTKESIGVQRTQASSIPCLSPIIEISEVSDLESQLPVSRSNAVQKKPPKGKKPAVRAKQTTPLSAKSISSSPKRSTRASARKR